MFILCSNTHVFDKQNYVPVKHLLVPQNSDFSVMSSDISSVVLLDAQKYRCGCFQTSYTFNSYKEKFGGLCSHVNLR
jgi:hypothetical protein